MLKKITALLTGLALFGCSPSGENVTEDMLIGSWICQHQRLYNIEKTATDDRNSEINDIQIKYEKQKNNSMTEQYYNLPPKKFLFERYKKIHRNFDENIEFDRTLEYQYVSDDEFKHVETYSSRYRSTKKPSELNVYTTTCVRQKN
ncbi:hypothetical protein A9G11_03540 [Gilliamella sp. wkB108]|uniref:hypothetical protein n=1 Tax=Gilliamella sp. wkB108 TaxID=3120256 RepID=UPI00080DB5B3|nr:hypothetical protein [Gilliamella apicola]OCG24740.1 hypothetical protein A9G11_03540 [Gilliamella apicola]